MNRILSLIAVTLLCHSVSAGPEAARLKCENRHDQSSQFELSPGQKTAVLKVRESESEKSFQMECMDFESDSFSIGCQDSGMPSLYQVIVTKEQDRAFLYEYGHESAVIMSDLQCF